MGETERGDGAVVTILGNDNRPSRKTATSISSLLAISLLLLL
jgi:hypothetical protein